MTAFPNYDRFVEHCKKEVEAKDEAYGSMWKDYVTKPWWFKRLMNEVKEVEAALTVAEERRKYVNIANLAAMAWEQREYMKE